MMTMVMCRAPRAANISKSPGLCSLCDTLTLCTRIGRGTFFRKISDHTVVGRPQARSGHHVLFVASHELCAAAQAYVCAALACVVCCVMCGLKRKVDCGGDTSTTWAPGLVAARNTKPVICGECGVVVTMSFWDRCGARHYHSHVPAPWGPMTKSACAYSANVS